MKFENVKLYFHGGGIETDSITLAEGERFELSEAIKASTVFKTAGFNRSPTLPLKKELPNYRDI